jgi:hypothetical protein
VLWDRSLLILTLSSKTNEAETDDKKAEEGRKESTAEPHKLGFTSRYHGDDCQGERLQQTTDPVAERR